MSESENPFELSPVQRKALQTVAGCMLQSGQAITVPKFGQAASAMLGWKVGDQAGPAILTELGYRPSGESEPQLGAGGTMEVVPTWTLPPRAKPMSPTERAQALSARISELTEAFVAETLGDAALAEATLPTRATEMTRIFALELGHAVSARAKVAGPRILEDCAMIANLAFKGA